MSTALLLDSESALSVEDVEADRISSAVVAPPPATRPAIDDRPPASGPLFKATLENAVCLLEYAAEAGIIVEAELAQRIIVAGRRGDSIWDDASSGRLMSDITKLGALLYPVTAVTLRASDKEAHDTIRSYKWVAVILAAFVIPWSVMSFVFNGINSNIAADIAGANQLVVSLHGQLEPPASQAGIAPSVTLNTLSDMQQFAASIRSIYRHTRELTWFVPGTENDPVNKDTRLELDANLSPQSTELRSNLDQLTAAYQQVRGFAKYTQDDGATVYGAVTACILPIFYALLGACAYLLRVFSSQLTTRTFATSHSTVARFVVAAIAGSVVGLFNNFGVGQVATLSPLAIAFLAGYGADLFFSFVDGAVNNVTRSRAR
jgi:hypothetical protein